MEIYFEGACVLNCRQVEAFRAAAKRPPPRDCIRARPGAAASRSVVYVRKRPDLLHACMLDSTLAKKRHVPAHKSLALYMP